jgi:hypothetical protein
MMKCSFVFSSRTLSTNIINYYYLIITATLTTAEPIYNVHKYMIYAYALGMYTAIDKTVVERLKIPMLTLSTGEICSIPLHEQASFIRANEMIPRPSSVSVNLYRAVQ